MSATTSAASPKRLATSQHFNLLTERFAWLPYLWGGPTQFPYFTTTSHSYYSPKSQTSQFHTSTTSRYAARRLGTSCPMPRRNALPTTQASDALSGNIFRTSIASFSAPNTAAALIVALSPPCALTR